MTVTIISERPSDTRSVPVLTDPDVCHYPEFSSFLSDTFGLADNPLESPGLLDVDGRGYEFIFIGRSGRPFPTAVEIAALVPGLEPMDEEQTNKDLWAILEWLIEGVGEPWTIEDLRTTGDIFRVIPDNLR